jgi:hypothetical protein
MADEEHDYKGSGLPADALNEPVLGSGLGARAALGRGIVFRAGR